MPEYDEFADMRHAIAAARQEPPTNEEIAAARQVLIEATEAVECRFGVLLATLEATLVLTTAEGDVSYTVPLDEMIQMLTTATGSLVKVANDMAAMAASGEVSWAHLKGRDDGDPGPG